MFINPLLLVQIAFPKLTNSILKLPALLIIVNDDVVAQPKPSVRVTEYVPSEMFVMLLAVPPLLQR